MMIFKSPFHSERVSGICWRIPRCKAELELCSSTPQVVPEMPGVGPADRPHQSVQMTPCHSTGPTFPRSCPPTATGGAFKHSG